jgi:hypothetical protein
MLRSIGELYRRSEWTISLKTGATSSFGKDIQYYAASEAKKLKSIKFWPVTFRSFSSSTFSCSAHSHQNPQWSHPFISKLKSITSSFLTLFLCNWTRKRSRWQSPSLNTILSQSDWYSIFAIYSPSIHLNSTLPARLGGPTDGLNHTYYARIYFPIRPTCPSYLVSLI